MPRNSERPIINWDDPAAVEALLAQEGLGDIDETLTSSKEKRLGVGSAAMTAASANEQDQKDFDEANAAPEFDLSRHLDSEN